MSQNTHTLLLFFKDATQNRRYHDLLAQIEDDEGDNAQTEDLVDELGECFFNVWTGEWFNHEIYLVEQNKGLRLQFDTSSREGAPFEVLQSLFSKGLKAAVLEIFFDQVGEIRRYHFYKNALVGMDVFTREVPDEAALALTLIPISEDAETDNDTDDYDEDADSHDDGYLVAQGKRISLSSLIEQEKKQQEDAKQMVDALIGISKLARETGSSVTDTVRSVLVLRALFKGVVQAVLFTIVTVLLFKGMWLWLSLGGVLLIVLPIFYVMQETKDFNENSNKNLENGNAKVKEKANAN